MSTISASTTSTTAYKVTADTTGTLVLQTGSTPTTAVTIGTDQSVTLAGTLAVQSQNISPYTGFKNRIINGAMMIDQRNAGASVTINSNQYTLDRYQAIQTQTGKYSVQQSSTAPAGFKNSMLITSASAYSILSTDTFYFRQSIEGYNVADLAFGTASAATVTLSFWVRSSLTGTFGGALKNDAGNRSYPFSYTISSANTWEQKTITIAGDQSGTWDTGTARGLQVIFGLGVGSNFSTTAGAWAAGDYSSATGATSVVGTSGATFYITGVQLEKGSTATSFDYRPYGTELALCQRYCTKYGGSQLYEHIGQGNAINSTTVLFDITLPTTMRATPSITTSGNWVVSDGITNTNVTSFGLSSSGMESSSSVVSVVAGVASGLTQFRPMFVYPNNSISSSFVASAEL